MPEELNGRKKVYLNEENIYITKTTPQSVVKLFQEQFYRDFSLFLTLRHEELVLGGQMVLTFCGRKNEDARSGSELNNLFGLLAQSLQSLVAEVHIQLSLRILCHSLKMRYKILPPSLNV
mgnify:CR=1 FL=1